jgi:hypothetical protein
MKIEFDEEQRKARKSASVQTGSITQLIIKHSGGLIKTPAGANLLMLIFIVFGLAATIFLMHHTLSPEEVTIILSPTGDNPLLNQ